MTNAASVKERLKNLSRKSNRTMQDCLVSYGMERSIYRLSVSKYSEHFILKGGIFLYALFGSDYPRATVDIDLLARRISNDSNQLKEIFKDIFSIEVDDALVYDLDSLSVKNITEFKKYHGVNVSVFAYLDRTRVPISIDIGFGDVIYPDCIEMEFPVLLEMDSPKIYAYSIYSIVAEKFEAITSLGLANSRYKDFYDICQIAKRFSLSGRELKESIQETFTHRGTDFEDIVAFEPEFFKDEARIQRWNAFVKKKKAMNEYDLECTITMLKAFLIPIVDTIKTDTSFDKNWNSETQEWE